MAVIYRHLKPCGEVFYIGIGNSLKRAYNKSSRSNFWKKVVKKYGYEVQILTTGLTREEACEIEILLISYYGRIDLGLGTLVNLTDGGDKGTVGRVMSEEQKNNQRLITSRTFKGVPKSEEFKRKLSIARLGVKKSQEMIEKRSATRIAKNETIKKYICTETLRTWGTIDKCAEDIGTTRYMLASYIDSNKVERNTSTIMLYEDYLKYGVIPPLVKVNEKIISINIETKVIFNSLRSAAKSISIDHKTLKNKLIGKSKNDTPFMLLKDYEEQQKLV